MRIEFIIIFIALILIIAIVAGIWKTFQKAGEPGWAAIVPIYNFIIMLKIAEKSLWWIAAFIGIGIVSAILTALTGEDKAINFIINLISLVMSYIIYRPIAAKFDKGPLITILMIIGIGWLILGFGDAQFKGDLTDMNEPDILHS